VICLVGIDGEAVVVHGPYDQKSSLLEAGCQTAATREEVDSDEPAWFAIAGKKGEPRHIALL
jgi:hypothetical protein